MESASGKGLVGGILHASGTLHDALIGQQTPAFVREVYAPKVAGAKALMRVTSLVHSQQAGIAFSERHPGLAVANCSGCAAYYDTAQQRLHVQAHPCTGRQLSASESGSAF